MDNLKQLIENNMDSFEQQNLPEGDEERFFARMEAIEKPQIHFHSSIVRRKVPFWRIVALPIAALFLCVLTIQLFVRSQREEEELKRIYLEYCAEVTNISTDINNMVNMQDAGHQINQTEKESIDRTIESITFEAIPMSSQLPKEMKHDEKVRIMKDYYSQKLEGIKRLKNMVSSSLIEYSTES